MVKQIRTEHRPRQWASLHDDVYRGNKHFNWFHGIRGDHHESLMDAFAKEYLANTGYADSMILLVVHSFGQSDIYICENFKVENGKLVNA